MSSFPGIPTAVGASGGLSRSLLRPFAGFGRDGGFGPVTQVLAAIVASVVVAAAFGQTDEWFIPLGAFAAIALVALGFMQPAIFLSAVLIIRPCLDDFSTHTFGMPGANAAGAVASLVVLLGLALALRRKATLLPATSLSWVLIAIITLGSSALAMSNYGATIGMEPVSDAIRVVSYATVFILAANVFATEDRVRKVFVVAGLSGVIPAIWGLIEWPTLEKTIYAIDIARVSGPFVGPNPLGQYLAVCILILVGMPKDWLSMRIRFLALAPMLICLVPTYSRVGWIMTVLGLAILEWKRRKHLVIGMVVIVVAVVMLVPSVHDRLIPSNTPTQGSAPTYESFGWRFDNWESLLQLWTERPFTGYGSHTTIYVNPRRTILHTLAPDGGFEAHNSVVRILVEGGLALMAGYLIFAFALTRSLKRMRQARWRLSPAAQLLTTIWLLILIVGLGTDDPFDNTACIFLLFTVTGALEGSYLLRAHRSTAGSEATSPLFLPARPRTS